MLYTRKKEIINITYTTERDISVKYSLAGDRPRRRNANKKKKYIHGGSHSSAP